MDLSRLVLAAAVPLFLASAQASAQIEMDSAGALSRLMPAAFASWQCRLEDDAGSDTPKGEAAVPPVVRLAPLSPRALYDPVVERTAQDYGVDSALLHAVIYTESRYDAKAVSKNGARGLMQLMPATARRYEVGDAFDPEQNIRGGARYLRDLLEMFDSDVRLVLAAYHAGEQAVIRAGYRIPPLKPTLDYVSRVLALYRHNRHAGNGDAGSMGGR
jgi:soluble lytic murein transglycosylase-like protein